MKTTLNRLFRRTAGDESGATAIEYGLIASLIVVALLSALHTFANANANTYNKIEQNIVR